MARCALLFLVLVSIAAPPRGDLAGLTAAALQWNPRVRIARARLQQAEAAVITAGEVPNPTFHVSPEIEFPWIFSVGLSMDFPHVPAAQRRLAVSAAQLRAEAAALALGRVAWQVRMAVRQALVAIDFARRERALQQQRVGTFAQWDAAAARRVAVGEAARPEALAVESALSAARGDLEAARRRLDRAWTALAAAVGRPVPAREVGDSSRFPGKSGAVPDLPSLLARAARNRLDVAAARAQVRAADAKVRLELARRHAGFTLSPSYNEQGNKDLGLGFAMAIPLNNQNQGPIAEAVAARALAAARFDAAEEQARREVDAARRQYEDARAALKPARLQLQAAAAREEAASQAVAVGEGDATALFPARLDTLGAQQAVNAAEQRVQQAVGALEDAVESPLEEPGMAP